MEQLSASNKMKRGYPFRIWAVAVLLPALIATVYVIMREGGEAVPLVGGGILIGGTVLSLPALAANYFLCRRLAQSTMETHAAKSYIVLAGFGFVIATFGIGILFWEDGGGVEPLLLGAVAAYSISAGIGAAVFQLREGAETSIPER